MVKFYLRSTALTFAILFFHSARLLSQEPHLLLTPVITGLTSPIQITNAGDGSNRLFVVLQGSSGTGTILVYDQSYVKLDTFLKVTNISTGGERGLLSIAFHPEYGNIASPFFGFFYVYYTNSNGDLQIARYQVSSNPDSADENSKDTVLTIPHPVNSNHNGGTIHFDSNGYLYLASGDGGDGGDPPNNAQNPMSLLGKMIRMGVNSSAAPPFYTSPSDNPYFGITTPDTLDLIYAFGLRNPFRWSFDRSTGDLWIGDVGQGVREEIDYRPVDSIARTNFGWRCYEGNVAYNTIGCQPQSFYQSPIFVYPNAAPSAVTGGVVYRGTLPANAALVGYYVATDYYSGNFYKIRPNGSGGWTVYTQTAVRTGVPSFGEAENGEIYVISQFTGSVYSIIVDAILPARLIDVTAIKVNSNVLVKWKTSFEENMNRFEVEYSTDGINFHHAGLVTATNRTIGSEYSFLHTFSYSGRLFYRLKMINIDNSFEYSSIVFIEKEITDKTFVRPSLITSGIISIYLNHSFNTLELINMKGEMVFKQNISGRTGKIDINIPPAASGTYMVRLRSRDASIQQKVIIR